MKYEITIKVSDASISAGTNSNISAKLYGDLGTSGWLVVDPQTRDNFEKGSADPAYVGAADLGNLTKIQITSDRVNPQSDALFAWVSVADENGLRWKGDNPDPVNGFIEDKNGGTYTWPLRQVDPAAHRKADIDKTEKDIADRIAENQKRIDNAAKQSQGQTNEKIARLQNAINEADDAYKIAQLEKDLEKVNRKARAAAKGFVASVELTPNGNGYWTATTAEESASPDGPHPGFAVAGENYLEHSNGSFPGKKGLTKGVLTFRDGKIITGEGAVADITTAAAQGQEWAMRILTELGIPKPTKQRSIFDLLLGR